MKHICHISNLHNWNDTRIFYKECCSLADAGYKVTLIAVNADEGMHSGVEVISISNSKLSRIYRATVLAWKFKRKVLKTRAKVVHFHDPELIWIALILHFVYKKTIVFDVHENLTAQIQDKEWLKFKGIISWIYGKVERFASKYFHIVIAEDSYAYLFEEHSKSLTAVLNFPEVEKLKQFEVKHRPSENGILYVGVVSKIRGIEQILEALALLKDRSIPFTFHCVGPLETGILEYIETLPAYAKVKADVIFYGRKPLFEAYELAKTSKMALSLLHPTPNYIRSYSTKIFEYMAIGLPFVVSDFPLYNFVKEQKIGSCVDPFNVLDIANEFAYLLSDDSEIDIQIIRAKKVVSETYSWESQRANLLDLYSQIAQ